MHFSDFILPLFPFIFFLIFIHKWLRPSKPRKNLPPSPRKLPIIGNLHQLGSHPHRTLQSLSNRYGPLMMLHFGKSPVLIVSSSDAARQIMKNQDLTFSNRPKLRYSDKISYGSKDVAFSPYGEYWRQMKSISVIQLLSNKRVQSFRHIREEETSVMIEKIRVSASLSRAVNLSDVMEKLTNDVVCRVALGRKYGGDGEVNVFKNVLDEFTELLGTFSVGDFIPWLGWIDRLKGLDDRVERVCRSFDEFLEGVLEEHREKQGRTGGVGEEEQDSDFVDILLEYQRENKAGLSLEGDAIKALIMDVFAAGTDTTFTALEWTIAELLRHPKTMETLQNEVRQVASTKQELTEDDLDKMPYLKAVIKESLRLHCPVPLLVPRESTEDTKVLGYDIEFGTRIIVNAWAISRDPSIWANPEEFKPERFFETSIDFRGLHFELIPFGAGRRGCPGITFAVSVNELALAKLVHQFDFVLPDGTNDPGDLDMTESSGITVHKKFPLIVVAKPHKM